MLRVKPLLLRQQAPKVVEAVAVVDSPATNKVCDLLLGLSPTPAWVRGASQALKKMRLLIAVQMQLSVIVTLELTTTAPSLLVMMEYVKIAIPEETVPPVATMTVEEVDVVAVVAVVIMTDIAEL
jgi:hypothetical protein